jgi:hypothetical protein
MSIDDEHFELRVKYDALKEIDGITHTDLQAIDELFTEFDKVYNDPTFHHERLQSILCEIDCIIDDIFIEMEEG